MKCKHDWLFVYETNYFKYYICNKCKQERIEAKWSNE